MTIQMFKQNDKYVIIPKYQQTFTRNGTAIITNEMELFQIFVNKLFLEYRIISADMKLKEC